MKRLLLFIATMLGCFGTLASTSDEIPTVSGNKKDSDSQNSSDEDKLKDSYPLFSAPETPSTEAEMTGTSSRTVQQDIQESRTTDSVRISETPSTKSSDKLSNTGVAVNEKPKSPAPDSKRARQSESNKKVEVGNHPLKANKAQTSKGPLGTTSDRCSATVEGKSNGLLDTNGKSSRVAEMTGKTVEEKLDDLLDANGGISKGKDALKGYLYLLLLTQASLASGHGETIQSNRDLSMILDPLLKTKSRTTLMRLLKKNGLQMLHNIMKQYKGDSRKIPILRKLLRVLEYLAVKEILSLEQINGDPPSPGMESFQESMLSLTEHDDKQVHDLARNFRNKWIPRHLRRYSHTEKKDTRAEINECANCNKVSVPNNRWRAKAIKRTDAVTCAAHSNPGTSRANSAATVESNSEAHVSDAIKTGKRKSRWDRDAPVSRSFRHDAKKFKTSADKTGQMVINKSKGGKMETRDSTSTTCNLSEDSQSSISAKRARPDWEMPCPNVQHSFKRTKGCLDEPGRRYFGQEQCIKELPWMRRHNH